MQYLKVVFHLRCDCVWRCSCHQYALFIFRFVSYRLINFYRKYAFATTKKQFIFFGWTSQITWIPSTISKRRNFKESKQIRPVFPLPTHFLMIHLLQQQPLNYRRTHLAVCNEFVQYCRAWHRFELFGQKKNFFFCLISQRLSNRNSSSIQKKNMIFIKIYAKYNWCQSLFTGKSHTS